MGASSSSMPEKLRKMRRVSHSPTDRPSRRAAARAASRASGGIPATFQGSSARIESVTPHPLGKVSAPRYSVKVWCTYEVRPPRLCAKSCTEFWDLSVNAPLAEAALTGISVGAALGAAQAQGIGGRLGRAPGGTGGFGAGKFGHPAVGIAVRLDPQIGG